MWRITVNYLAPEENQPEDLYQSSDLVNGVPLPVQFQLLDEDGVACFQGRMTVKRFNGDEAAAFAPLLNYGILFGCKSIQFKLNNDAWSTPLSLCLA